MSAARPAPLIAVAALLLLPACISLLGTEPKKPDMHRHIVDAAAGVSPHTGAAAGLAVRTFAARSRYDIRVLRRDGPDSFAYLEYERWAETPADAATDAIREGLATSGAFAFVAPADQGLAVERYLDGYVLGFDLMQTPSGPWKARFSARLSLSDRTGKMLHSGVYETTRDLPGPGPVDLGPAMSAAIGAAVNKALADWAAAGLLVSRGDAAVAPRSR